jgi:hypothetical protein
MERKSGENGIFRSFTVGIPRYEYIIGMTGQREKEWVGYVARTAFRHALAALVEKHKG